MTGKKKKKTLRNPLIPLLAVLLAFVVIGAAFSGCLNTGSDRIRVAIDAAYGGDQTGYTGIINEADFNEGVVNALCERRMQDQRFITIRTHEAGTAQSVLNTVKEVNERNADMVLSIHAGYDPDPEKTGMRIYAEKPGTSDNERSLGFAEAIRQVFAQEYPEAAVSYMYYEPLGVDKYQMKVVPCSDETDYGLETWTLMEKTLVPTVVTEQIYVSNETDVSAWANEEGYKKAGELYYQALCEYYGLKPLPVQEGK